MIEPQKNSVILLLTGLNIFLAIVLSFQTIYYGHIVQKNVFIRQTEIITRLELSAEKQSTILEKLSGISKDVNK